MKYIEAISRNWILSLIPAEGLDDNARTTIVLNQVAYDSAIAAFEEEQAEVVKKLKPEGFDEKMQRFALALGVREATTDEERKKAEELKETPSSRPSRSVTTRSTAGPSRRAARRSTHASWRSASTRCATLCRPSRACYP